MPAVHTSWVKSARLTLLWKAHCANPRAEAFWFVDPSPHNAARSTRMVFFKTPTVIVNRNGITMISPYIHLMGHEGEVFGEALMIRGSQERPSPVMMPALFFGFKRNVFVREMVPSTDDR